MDAIRSGGHGRKAVPFHGGVAAADRERKKWEEKGKKKGRRWN
jgi:hypothetical protein